MSNTFFLKKKYYFDVFTSKKYVKIQSILEYQRSSDAKISKATSLFSMEVSHLQPKRYLSKLLVCLKSSWYTYVKYIFFKKNIILMYLQAKSILKYNRYWNIKGARMLKYQKQHLFSRLRFRIFSQNDIYLNS